MSNMRAKMRVSNVETFRNPDGSTTGEKLTFHAVAKSEAYPADGSDDDNTFARYSPSAELSIHIANPSLFGGFEVGQKYYVDFSPA